MGKEHIARVYGLGPDQVALDERLTLFVLAESTADDREGFAHRRIDIAERVGFGGNHPEKTLARRMSDLEAAGFVRQSREKNEYGQWTGRIYVELTIEDGGQTPRGVAAASRAPRPRPRDDKGRFHQPQPMDDGPSATAHGGRQTHPSATGDGSGSSTAHGKPSAVSHGKPSATGHGGESPDIDPIKDPTSLLAPDFAGADAFSDPDQNLEERRQAAKAELAEYEKTIREKSA